MVDVLAVPAGEPFADRHPYHGDALERWKLVHRSFFVMTAFILLALTKIEAACEKDDPAELRAALLRLETLLLGSAVTLRLAGDFPSGAYGAAIRDDMAAYDPEFTGSFSADHARMIKRLAILAQVPPYARDEHGRVLAALDTVYRCHAHVCERFVGRAPSLAQGEAVEGTAIDRLLGPFRERSMRRAGCPFSSGTGQP